MRITFSKTLLLATTAFSMISVPAANAYLSPLSFNEMYAHASRGNLTVLNNAILRGMNINAVNGDGDTGICVAIRRGDHIAYESFRNTGAHTRPRCLNNINAKQYKKFMADHRPYELAYRKEGSSIWWWIRCRFPLPKTRRFTATRGWGTSLPPATLPNRKPRPMSR